MFTPSQYQAIGAAKAALVFGSILVIVSCLRAEPITTEWERKVAPKAAQVEEEPSWLVPAPEPESEDEDRLCRSPHHDGDVWVYCSAL